jgi:hypothetical protein
MLLASRIILVSLLLAAPALGAVLIGNLPGTGDLIEINLGNMYTGSQYAAVGFRTGADQLLFDQVTFRFYGANPYTGNPVAPLAGLYSGTDTTITSLVADLTGPANLVNGIAQQVSYTPTIALTLSPNTVYWLVLQGPSSGTGSAWYGTTNPAKTPSSGAGLIHLAYRGGAPTIGGMFAQDDKYFYYEILGSVVTGGGDGGGDGGGGEIPEATTMVLLGTGLLALRMAKLRGAAAA